MSTFQRNLGRFYWATLGREERGTRLKASAMQIEMVNSMICRAWIKMHGGDMSTALPIMTTSEDKHDASVGAFWQAPSRAYKDPVRTSPIWFWGWATYGYAVGPKATLSLDEAGFQGLAALVATAVQELLEVEDLRSDMADKCRTAAAEATLEWFADFNERAEKLKKVRALNDLLSSS